MQNRVSTTVSSEHRPLKLLVPADREPALRPTSAAPDDGAPAGAGGALGALWAGGGRARASVLVGERLVLRRHERRGLGLRGRGQGGRAARRAHRRAGHWGGGAG